MKPISINFLLIWNLLQTKSHTNYFQYIPTSENLSWWHFADRPCIDDDIDNFYVDYYDDDDDDIDDCDDDDDADDRRWFEDGAAHFHIFQS